MGPAQENPERSELIERLVCLVNVRVKQVQLVGSP